MPTDHDSTTTILLVDDHGLVRDSLAGWLDAQPDLSVIATAANADEGLNQALEHRPDIVVFDIDMPGRISFDVAKTLRARLPETRIAFLSAFCHDRYIQQALEVEAAAYITKSESPDVVADAIRAVAAGNAYFSPEVQDRIVVDGRRITLAGERTRASTLSPRELEVLRYIARGLSKKEIGATMHISVKTVDNHCTSLMAKLDVHDRVELARFAIREGLVEA
ncbi:MAG: response regulator transcription factor [Planctomycetota bacterium]